MALVSDAAPMMIVDSNAWAEAHLLSPDRDFEQIARHTRLRLVGG